MDKDKKLQLKRFERSMDRIKRNDWSLKHIDKPCTPKPQYTGDIDIHKFSRDCIVRDVHCHQPLRHSFTFDKTEPVIPAHTKQLRNYDRQRLCDEINQKRVE
ncbi:hypothetical protein EIN_085660 [Entamoeba invadens IP1]|uniref:hypothetical protein n=1 Tax=Entamoeba invadens IP1 TaxID=370355 RepID=UPI0002C3DD36|nr:hypothetical protein EIN_085660 [Entamoeba invadens IP1]ELP85324.1 hypothetical protein EIN_085660 [Entamoeba invadens IP1]|eukprot:XP_004184670.1 hypothetical protein EIN_085660 [Entamoeba invadens IP1]